MQLEIGLPGWEVRIEERSANVWLVRGRHASGASFEFTTSASDPAQRARAEALEIEAHLRIRSLV
ncbi:hypothetical protein SAMN05421819_3100 [Bryocella elongata]|uniref:Uncharacterized protein n=1 Tax=Bryocella elongata TaxID=863522 RepID=A0A1H6AFT5_9BACT|nr:hypothetical protein [Bryocella elongata]SEG46927.1 hypothetical protein SAMN05421819_3100 [Bryocella elongata]